MSKLLGLVVDLKVTSDASPSTDVLRDALVLEHVFGVQAARHILGRQTFDVAFLDFDFPQRFILQDIVQLKRDFPSVPMIMLSVEHSEDLVLWAFRSRLWDFLAKPVADEDWMRCVKTLEVVRRHRDSQPHRRVADGGSHAPPAGSNDGLPLMKAIYFIEGHFTEEIRSDALAKLCGMSTFHFSRVFKETFGIGVRDYVLRRRLAEARKLASNGDSSVASISYAVGFNDPAYFSRAFKRFFGITPSESMGTPVPEKLIDQAELRLAAHE